MFVLAPLLVLLLIGYVGELRNARAISLSRSEFSRSPIARASVVFIALLTVPWWLVHHVQWTSPWQDDPRFLFATSLLVSALISYTWYRYLTWLDPFEREPMRWEVTVFLMACSLTLLVPDGYRIIEERFGLTLTGDHWNDWWYCVGVIGGLEEVAKLIPLLFVWKFTRHLNEPYDFLLYASISALGFACVENVGYLRSTELGSVMGRAVMATVAHMFFASIPAYGIAIALHRGRGQIYLRLLLLLGIAAVGHGFYDFWLLDASRPGILTVLFFFASLQLWVIMKNNLINISPHYAHRLRPASRMFRYRIINGMLFVLAVAYVGVYAYRGMGAADQLLKASASGTAIVLLMTAMHFSAYSPIPGYLAPLRLSGNVFTWFMPRMEWEHDLTGARVELRPHSQLALLRRWTGLMAELPVSGTVERRSVVGDEGDWYLLRPDRPLRVGDHLHRRLLLRVHADYDTLQGDRMVMVRIAAPYPDDGSDRAHWEKHDLLLLGHPLARLLPATGMLAAAL